MINSQGLTPELSRPVAGRRTCASVAQSTWPTPRHGVGLNDLLGGPDAGDAELRTSWPKTEVRQLERAPQTLRRPSPKRPHLERTNRPQANHSCRSRQTQRMQCVSAPDELDRRSDVPTNSPKSNADRSRHVAGLKTQLPNALCRLTLELSRPVAGWRTRASVAQARGRRHDAGSA